MNTDFMNPKLIAKHGFKNTHIRCEGNKRVSAFGTTINGRQIWVDEQIAGDSKFVIREIELVTQKDYDYT